MHIAVSIPLHLFVPPCRRRRCHPLQATCPPYLSSEVLFLLNLRLPSLISETERRGEPSRLFVAFSYKVYSPRGGSYYLIYLSYLGMVHEKLMPADSHKILSIYLTAVFELPTLEAEIARMSPPNPTLASGDFHNRFFAAFARYRELWRWVERLLWRAIIIAS